MNYVLFNNVNDSFEDAKNLYQLLGSEEIIKINKFNYVSLSVLEESKKINEFIQILKHYGMSVEYYETNGADINAACGQMITSKKLVRRI